MIQTTRHIKYLPVPDGELELVQPSGEYCHLFQESSRHELTRTLFPGYYNITEEENKKFLSKQPLGHGWSSIDKQPLYWYWMLIRNNTGDAVGIAGDIQIRIADSEDVESALGNYAYHVFPQNRGNHYAARSVKILFPLAVLHGMTYLWLTCHPNNIASRKTAEYAGFKFVDISKVPEGERYVGFDCEKGEACRFYKEL